MRNSRIEIDGSHGEGGGQILRTSLALSLLTSRPFHMRKIRAGRAKPGLQAQHLMSVQAAAKIGHAKTRGDHLGSVDLTFEPGQVKAGDFHFKIGTAGATSLVLHTIYLPLALAGGDSTVILEGGTHVKASPCFHFLDRSWARYLRTIGSHVELRLDHVGFYPRGGGVIQARIAATPRIAPFRGMTTHQISKATLVVMVAGLPSHVGERMEHQALVRLRELGLEIESTHEKWGDGPGCMLGVELPTEPAPTFLFALGEKGKPAEAVAHEAVDQVANFLSAEPLGVDEHTADQLLLPLVLAREPSEFRVSTISSHLLTNAAVIRQFIDRKIECDGSEGETGVVRII